ncbi:MAG TPA: hypothetical protein PKI32_08995 [Opitutales bacterium]|nr:hypothetical protein [Opitutales bacterium]
MRSVLLVPLLFLCACSTLPTSTEGTNEEGAPRAHNQSGDVHTWKEVSARIQHVYLKVLDEMTRKYFAAYPELDRAHTKAMREFILNELSPEAFAVRILRASNPCRSIAGLPPLEATPGLELSDTDASELIDTAYPCAIMDIEMVRTLYEAEFVDKNPFVLELLAMDTEKKYTEYIAIVSKECMPESFLADCGITCDGYEYCEGDRFFDFCTSQEAWDHFCGYEGYLIVRDGKIITVITTSHN